MAETLASRGAHGSRSKRHRRNPFVNWDIVKSTSITPAETRSFSIRLCEQRSTPIIPVETPILHCFRNMLRGDVPCPFQIRRRARDFQDAVVRARR